MITKQYGFTTANLLIFASINFKWLPSATTIYGLSSLASRCFFLSRQDIQFKWCYLTQKMRADRYVIAEIPRQISITCDDKHDFLSESEMHRKKQLTEIVEFFCDNISDMREQWNDRRVKACSDHFEEHSVRLISDIYNVQYLKRPGPLSLVLFV